MGHRSGRGLAARGWGVRRAGFTLVEIMIVVILVGLLSAIAIPSYVRSREVTQMDACIHNLVQIDGAKTRYALENNKTMGDVIEETEIREYFVKRWSGCPAGGVYTINPVGTDPTCNIEGHTI